MLNIIAGATASIAGVLNTEKTAVIPPLLAQLATPTHMTNEMKTVAKK
tara:strand:- start:772 stop:915 length:144 start_codon:yes stop_codon:yes gene_type:complete